MKIAMKTAIVATPLLKRINEHENASLSQSHQFGNADVVATAEFRMRKY